MAIVDACLDMSLGRCGVVVAGAVLPVDEEAPWVTGEAPPLPKDRMLAQTSPEFRQQLRRAWVERLEVLASWSCRFGGLEDPDFFGLVVVSHQHPDGFRLWSGWVGEAGFATLGWCGGHVSAQEWLVAVNHVQVPEEVAFFDARRGGWL